MFDIGWTELLVIAVVAIVVIGPKDLPRAMRLVGQWTGKLKRMGREFQGQFNEALREAELDDVRKGVEALGKMDPLASVRNEVAKVGADIKKGMDVTAPGAAETQATAASGTPPPAETPTPALQPVEAAPPPPPAEPAGATAGEVKP